MDFAKPLVLLLLGSAAIVCLGCSNYIVTKGASENGHTYISYAADSWSLYGELYRYPAADHAPGDMREVYDWDTGKYIGKIPEAAHTYSVIGNTNEFQVTIAETTYGGLEDLCDQPTALIDYGSLIWIGLQRSKTAREAIQTMTSLVAEYGYTSEGESFSIGDPNEAWILELIGKGKHEKGAVWVARKIPDGYISGHANQARITTFPQDKSNNDTIYSDDVISFARGLGLYSGSDADFSFSDVYDPVTELGARGCDARVWYFLKDYQQGFEQQYLSYVQGKDLANRMPLWVEADHKVTRADLRTYMRNHYENTWFDMYADVGAEPAGWPYRFRPLTWDYQGNTYCNERAVGTQQTGWSFISEMRPEAPRVSGLFWFGVDDADNTVWFPVYSGATEVPTPFGPGDITQFDTNKAFWAFNLVANFAYWRYNQVHDEIASKQTELETKFDSEIAGMDAKIEQLWNAGKEDEAIAVLSDYTVTSGNLVHKEWMNLFGSLFAKYFDGAKRKPLSPGQVVPDVDWVGYDESFEAVIVEKTGDHFLTQGDANLKARRFKTVDKRKLI